jgi:2-polyprenyl-6-methoxyphenol hydroxylase-like FAD-dependent oxidoreductase
MSPIGGVGINMAVQDAVAAANRLAGPLRSSKLRDEDLQAIQDRRTLPVRFTQSLQLTIQRRIISRVLESERRPKPPLFFKLFEIFLVLRRIPARLREPNRDKQPVRRDRVNLVTAAADPCAF